MAALFEIAEDSGRFKEFTEQLVLGLEEFFALGLVPVAHREETLT